MPTWMNCYNGSTGSSESANNAAKDLDLFTSSATAGYNYDSDTIKSGNGLWEARCFGRAHSYNSTDHTYSYSMYVFAKKLNSATSWGDSFKVTFYYRGKSTTNSGLTRYLNGSGETRLISSHTFTGLSWSPSGTSTIGAKVTGEEGTEVYQTIDLTQTANFNDDSWSVASTTTSSIKVSGTKIANRNYRHARLFQYRKGSNDYTTDDTVNYVAANEGGSATHTYSSLAMNTSYDVRVQFRLRNYKPKNTSSDTESSNNPVVLAGGLTWSSSATTDKGTLSGSVSLGGSRQIGKTLTANVDNPDNATLAYQWSIDTNGTFVSGDGTQTALSGETSSSLVVPTSALDKYIYCKVTFTKDNYNTKTIRKYTSAVAYRQPFSGSVTITGTNKMNGTLTASVTTTSDGTKTYQWWTSTSSTATSGTAISGATSSTFKVTSAQIGKYIGVTVKITQTNTYEAGTINDITSGTAAEIAPTVTAPTMKSSLTYAGSSLALINAGSVTGGTMYYYASTSSTTPAASSITSTSVPKGLPTTAGAAQTYHVWYKVTGSAGYTDVGVTKIGSVAVNPGTFTVTKVPYSGNYDGSSHKASIKVNLAGCTVKSGTASGTYGTSDSTNTTANTAVTLGATSRTNAGTTTVYYQVTKSYYKTVTGSTTIDIAKASLSATVTASGTAQYGKTLSTVIQTQSGAGTESYQWWHSTSSTATSGTNISGATGYSYTIGSGLIGKYIGVTVTFAESTNYLGGTRSDIIPSAVVKAAGGGSVTMNGWTYGGTVPNPTPSSSTNGTSGVSYTWYNSNKTPLSAKPTSTSNAGIYYVRATFPAATDYNAYTTDYVGFVVLPHVSISVSQDYLKGDYGVPAGTVTYSLGGGIGSCTNITLSSGAVTVFNNAAIASTGSAHPKSLMGTSFTYSISYKDAANATKTLQGTTTISSYPQNKAFAYTYAHKNANGSAVTGTVKDFTNDGQKDKQFYLTAGEWNEMVKFLYSAAYRKNSWSNSGLSAPAEVKTGDKLTAAIYNAVLVLAEKAASKTYTDVTSGSRLSAAQFNGFKDIINNSR